MHKKKKNSRKDKYLFRLQSFDLMRSQVRPTICRYAVLLSSPYIYTLSIYLSIYLGPTPFLVYSVGSLRQNRNSPLLSSPLPYLYSLLPVGGLPFLFLSPN